MQSLEAACEEADHILHIAKTCPQTVLHPTTTERNGHNFYNIHQKLLTLYEEECARESINPNGNLKISSQLIGKLMCRDRLNALIFRLYPGNKGYSVGIRVPEGETESVKYPYSQDDILLCLDSEEIPYMMLDHLEEKHAELFYSGCIVAEVHDHRRGFLINRYTRTFVLLKPSTRSLMCDVNVLSKNSDLNRDERLLLESQLVLATQAPLCLDPSPSVALTNNRLQYETQPFGTKQLRNTARKFTQVALNRKRKLDQFTAHPEFKLHSFLSRQPTKLKQTLAPVPKKISLEPTGIPEGGIEVPKLARSFEKPRETTDCTPHLVEEYILEADRGQGKCYHIKVSILQRASDGQFLGELYVDRDYKEGERNGSACRFPLGNRSHATRYISQFTEIFTEEGRKSVRITHCVPGQASRVTCTAGMKEREEKLKQAQALMKAHAAQSPMQPPMVPLSPQAPSPLHPSNSLPSPGGASAAAAMTNGTALSPKSPMLASPKTPVPSSPRHMANPSISTIVNDLMNSAQQFQQANAATKDAATPNAMTSGIPTQVSANSNNSAILSILNSNNNKLANHVQQPSPTRQAIAQKLMAAQKMTITDMINAGLIHSTQLNSVQNPQHVRLSLSPLVGSPPANNQGQQFTISTNAGYTTFTSGNNVGFTSVPIANKMPGNNVGYTSVPIAAKPIVNNVGYATIPIASKPQGNNVNVGYTTVPIASKPPSGNVGFTTIPISPKPPVGGGSFAGVPISSNHVVKHAANARRASGGDGNLGLSMPGLSALLAGTPSADNPAPGNSNSTLLDRLTAGCANTAGSPGYPASTPSPKAQYPQSPATSSSPLSSPPNNINIQKLNCIESLQGAITAIPGLQNVQVTIPGLVVPLSVSLNVSAAGSLVTSNHNQNVVLTSSSSRQPILSLPVAQLMASGMKGLSHQNLRSSLVPNASISLPQVGGQSIQLQLQRPRGILAANQALSERKVAVGRTLLQRPTYRTAPAGSGMAGSLIGPTTQVVTLTPQQQHQLAALQKQQLQNMQCMNQSVPSSVAAKHRRRSNAADPSK